MKTIVCVSEFREKPKLSREQEELTCEKAPLEIINQLDESIACSPWNLFLISEASLALPANVNAMQRELDKFRANDFPVK